MERKGSNPCRPALFTRIVGRPRRARTSSTPASIWGRSVTSTVTPRAVPPDASILEATSLAEPPSRSKTATAAPSAASRSLIARPMPEPPPVTIAVRRELSDGDAVEDQLPQLLGGVAVARRAGPADRRGKGVEHDRLEDDAVHAPPAEVIADNAGGDGIAEHLVEE